MHYAIFRFTYFVGDHNLKKKLQKQFFFAFTKKKMFSLLLPTILRSLKGEF
jgi:hypothetical protein